MINEVYVLLERSIVLIVVQTAVLILTVLALVTQIRIRRAMEEKHKAQNAFNELVITRLKLLEQDRK
jgi:hypothetical protein